MNVIGVKSGGSCLFCTGDKPRDLLVVKSAGFNGEVCGKHLIVIAKKQTKPQEPAPAAPKQ